MNINEQLLDALKEIREFNAERVWSPKIGELCGKAIAAAEQAQQAEPVAAQSRFEGDEEWQPCTVAHHLLVQAHPKEWPHYETRALYTQPPSQPVPRDVLMAALQGLSDEVVNFVPGGSIADPQQICDGIRQIDLAAIADRYAAQPPAVAVAVPDATGGKLRLLVAACNRIEEEAEEFEGPDGLEMGIAMDYWHEFAEALTAARKALAAAQKGGA